MTNYVIKAPLKDIVTDSRQVRQDSLFLAYPGQQYDGRHYIEDAIKQGASAIVWDSNDFTWNPNWNIRNVPIPDLLTKAGLIASQYFHNPSEKLWCIGITGTNGKTTVSHWLSQAFAFLQKKSAVIGTLGYGQLKQLVELKNTTPGAVEVQKIFAGFVKEGIEIVAMEVSSHGLDQGRVNGVSFDVAVFTNLSHDHLDYHKDMQSYQVAKGKLFDWKTLKACVINHDDVFGQQLITQLTSAGKTPLTYGIKQGDVRVTKFALGNNNIEAQVETPQGSATLKLATIGEHNLYNALAVLAGLLVSNIPLQQAVNALEGLSAVAGRMLTMGGGNLPLVVIDYAHTPDALEKALKALRSQVKSRLICVFGCGGERDAEKRPVMGEVAKLYADLVMVTSDNPRNENPEKIIEDILKGMSSDDAHGSYMVELDRAKAITTILSVAITGDVVLIAGKGHEKYQEVSGRKIYFSDEECVEKVLTRMKVD